MIMQRRAKIVATIGPASRSVEVMRRLILNGLNVARFNFSHGGPSVQEEMIARLRAVSAEEGIPIAILQDLQGPKIRTGALVVGAVTLSEGQEYCITTRSTPGDETEVSTTYQGLPRDCRIGDTILLDDGKIALRVEDTTSTDVVVSVTRGGELKPNKGINLPGVAVSTPALTDKDLHDVEWGIKNGLDFVALSFVRHPDDVIKLRAIIDGHNSPMRIIAKLEKPQAIEWLDDIIDAADGVMVARGDLGVEMEPEEVPLLQKRIIRRANAAGKLVITATQMLESMTQSPLPTRAEASDVANAVLDGTDALMLSGETAAGAYPVESLKMMARIIEQVEAESPDDPTSRRRTTEPDKNAVGNAAGKDFTDGICEAAAYVAGAMNAKAIVCFTESGNSARRLSQFRPTVPIIACTPHEDVARQLQMAWGVLPHLVPSSVSTDDMLLLGDHELQRSGFVVSGDTVVVTLGAPVAMRGSTNLMKLHCIGEARQ